MEDLMVAMIYLVFFSAFFFVAGLIDWSIDNVPCINRWVNNFIMERYLMDDEDDEEEYWV